MRPQPCQRSHSSTAFGFEIPETSTNDSLGAIWTEFTDPEGFGDAYRWSSMRLGKDADFFYPLGGVFDDAFVDGRSFPFLSFRSPQPGVEEVPGRKGFGKPATRWS